MALNLGRLNAPQRAAVLHASGPLLILAGAGSGKTSTMAHRIAHLISDRHLPGSAILGLSFTNKAATELKERVGRLVTASSGRKATRGLTITTFHSLCARLLRSHADALGFQTDFTIMDSNDQVDVLRQVLRNIKIDERRFDPDVLLFEISQAKNRLLNSQQAETFFLESGRLSEDYALAAAACYGKYQDHLRILNAMDFDDLMYYAVELLEKQTEIRDLYNYKFRHILVDEYQDTNATQFRILKLLTEKQQNLCVVGDDDQSIYGWRGADPSHILKFKDDYKEAKTITLEQNYRSTSRILEAANCVIEKNRNRYLKKLWSDRGQGEPLMQVVVEEDRAEGEFVAEEILRKSRDQNRPWLDFAILYRSNSQSRVFEEALRRNGIPYKIVGGLSFLARKEVKDVLAYWKLISNPKDDASLRRILNWPARGIGKTSVDTLGTLAFQRKISFFEALSETKDLPAKAAKAVNDFRTLILSMVESLAQTPAEPQAVANWARASLEKIQAKRAIEEDCDDGVQAAKKWENIDELLHSIGQFKLEPKMELKMEAATASVTPSATSDLELSEEPASDSSMNGTKFFREYLTKMMLDAQEIEKDEEKKDDSQKNQVTLLTLHGAKGMEYPVVFLVGMEEGFLPHRRTLEEATDFGEERRLCYVGITRAKDYLFLIRAKSRIRYGKPVPRLPSRFLAEIPPDLMLISDESGVPATSSAELEERHEAKVKNFLAEIRANLTKTSKN